MQGELAAAEQRASSFGGDGLARLTAFKAEVERGAFSQTMKLCEGYRRARGMGPSGYHGAYVYSTEESLGEWAKVAREGLIQPFSAMFGLKADYLAFNNVSLFAFHSWFRSLYSLYLINSMGFLQASMHCLNTMDQREINLFASAIVAVDLESTLVSELGLMWTGGRVLGLIIRVTSYVVRSSHYLLKLIGIRLSKTHLIIGGIVVGPILVENLMDYLRSVDQAKQAIKELLDFSPEGRAKAGLGGRRLLAAMAVQKLFEDPDFKTWALEHVSAAQRAQMHRDLADSSIEPNYKVILTVLMPALDPIDLK